MIHRPHPITGEHYGKTYNDPPDAILYDDCLRCYEHVLDPTGLDNETLYQLWFKQPQTDAEHKAHQVMRMAWNLTDTIRAMARKR